MDTGASSVDRRQHRRLRLQLPIGKLQGASSPNALSTSDISTGGMYFVTDQSALGAPGQEVAFELLVPPGAGYWPNAGKILGRGQVIRTTKLGNQQLGVALQFLKPLSLNFASVPQA